jgi:hypothetical protein
MSQVSGGNATLIRKPYFLKRVANRNNGWVGACLGLCGDVVSEFETNSFLCCDRSSAFCYDMKRRLLTLKARFSRNDRDRGENRQSWQAPALDNSRIVFQLLSNLGSGAINVPGLQAASKVAIQIIDIVKVRILQAGPICCS